MIINDKLRQTIAEEIGYLKKDIDTNLDSVISEIRNSEAISAYNLRGALLSYDGEEHVNKALGEAQSNLIRIQTLLSAWNIIGGVKR